MMAKKTKPGDADEKIFLDLTVINVGIGTVINLMIFSVDLQIWSTCRGNIEKGIEPLSILKERISLLSLNGLSFRVIWGNQILSILLYCYIISWQFKKVDTVNDATAQETGGIVFSVRE